MSGEKKEVGVLTQIFVAVAIALLAGGTAPWWWDKFFGSSSSIISSSPNTSPSPTTNSDQQQAPTLTAINQAKEDADLNLQFGFQGCQRSSNIVTCYFLLTKQADVTGLYQGRGYYIYANNSSFSRASRAITPDGEINSDST